MFPLDLAGDCAMTDCHNGTLGFEVYVCMCVIHIYR